MTDALHKILMIDDDELMLFAVKRFLEGTERFQVRTENKSANARKAAREFKPDLILLDVVMPTYDGGDVAKFLADDPLTRNIPVLFLTSMVTADQVEKHEGTIAGHPFVAKPAGMKEILRRIEVMLAGKGKV
ncbi:MAG TPA: response regulator [Kiritimatiellia bacterium]|jgi:DNA-binding response OmpR family regulator